MAARGLMRRVLSFFTSDGEEYEENEYGYHEPEPQQERGGKVLSIKDKSPRAQVALCNPQSFDETQQVADMIKNRRGVIVNMQRVDNELTRRVVDFLLGVTYAVDGEMHRIEERVFLFAPTNFEILPFEHREPVNDSVYFSPK